MIKKNNNFELQLDTLKNELANIANLYHILSEQFLLTTPFSAAILDKEKRIYYVNDNFTNMFQYTLEDIKGNFISNLVSSHYNKDLVNKNIEAICKGQIIKQEGKRKRKDGELTKVEVIGYPILYCGLVIGVYIIYIDISYKQIDTLTQLYNRYHLLDTVNDYIANYQKNSNEFSIIVLDTRGFREVNETLGYIIGDKLLVEISKRMCATLNENYLIYRIDVDKFAVLVNSANKSDLLYLSNLIISSLNQPYLISNNKIHINFNIGICRFPMDATNSGDLIKFAIAILKSKKTNNRINFYSDNAFNERKQRFILSNYLFSAIQNNELTLCYQPIFNIIDKKVVGAEALLRWHNSILGDVQPDEFIPIAEETGQILPIGEWVTKEVCKQINLWKEKDYDLKPISINISVKQLEDSNFARSTLNILRSNNVDSKLIELEITERVSSGDITIIAKNLKELRGNGIRISMDDFGKGFSSLGQLDILEIDKLKIDKVFIDNLANGQKVQKLVKTIIAMAESLNLVTVAEGIETMEQLYKLKGLGCQFGQGFIFSKPLKVHEIEKVLDSNK